MRFFILVIIIISLFTACKNNNETKGKQIIPKATEHSNNLPEAEQYELALGEATTPIIDKNENRINNIILACKSISGTEILPGNEFSFNEVVGERSTVRGYKEAAVMSNGEVSSGVGGGICQVSTTLYMAAANAGLEIKERHLHSETVAYAPNRTDATVVYGVLDMKFRNSTEEKIYIYTWIENETVYAKIIKKQYKYY